MCRIVPYHRLILRLRYLILPYVEILADGHPMLRPFISIPVNSCFLDERFYHTVRAAYEKFTMRDQHQLQRLRSGGEGKRNCDGVLRPTPR